MAKKKHIDDISAFENFTDVGDCEVIKNYKNWEIELIAKDNYLEDKNIPDWFGYLRIDKK